MILQALVNYYELLSQDSESKVPLRGYGKANVSYALVLSEEGEITGLIPLKQMDKRGKKEVPISLTVPEQEKKTSGVKSNFLCENAVYTFGIDSKGDKARAEACFQAFRDLHNQILGEVNCSEAKAVLNYVNLWEGRNAEEHPLLQEAMEDLKKGANIVLQFEGEPLRYIHQSPAIRAAWDAYKEMAKSGTEGQCLATGQVRPVARLHPVIKGIQGGQAMGNSLVSFNAPAYESYGKDKAQGLNAPVSEYAAFAYGTALNSLLADRNHKVTLGDTTVVFWAETTQLAIEDVMFLSLDPTELNLNETKEETVRDLSAVREMKAIFEKIREGKPVVFSDDIFDPNTKIYALGLSPNAARISIRFFIRDDLGGFIRKISKHYSDLNIEKQFDNEFDAIPIWKMVSETVNSNSKNKNPSPLLSGAVLRAILEGRAYPEALFQAVLTRIKAEQEIGYYKAAIIKACLLRKPYLSKRSQEVLTMSLDEKSKESKERSYVLGRLFAVLEKAQRDANPGVKLNKTIKDKYFTSACATPALIFPRLFKLYAFHVEKNKYKFYMERRVGEIMDLLELKENPLPKHLSLEEQGIFVLGYYHERNYKKSEKPAEDVKGEEK